LNGWREGRENTDFRARHWRGKMTDEKTYNVEMYFTIFRFFLINQIVAFSTFRSVILNKIWSKVTKNCERHRSPCVNRRKGTKFVNETYSERSQNVQILFRMRS
jgi:hypothetical protein